MINRGDTLASPKSPSLHLFPSWPKQQSILVWRSPALKIQVAIGGARETVRRKLPQPSCQGAVPPPPRSGTQLEHGL